MYHSSFVCPTQKAQIALQGDTKHRPVSLHEYNRKKKEKKQTKNNALLFDNGALRSFPISEDTT
jgi:hypothetical protein